MTTDRPNAMLGTPLGETITSKAEVGMWSHLAPPLSVRLSAFADNNRIEVLSIGLAARHEIAEREAHR